MGYAGGADGFFWMSWEDFCANWDTVLIANLPKAKSTRAAHLRVPWRVAGLCPAAG